jgi:uncharacterized membrane protein YheB (UPF0754 family)
MITNTYILWCIPPISAIIGWITNYIAVKMIFRPRKPIFFFGIKILGLIPKRKSDLARKIGETVEKELISHQDIHRAVNTPEFHEEIITSISNVIDNFIEQKLGANPLVAMMLSGEMAVQIKESLKNELRDFLPGFMENMFGKIENRLNFKEIVQNKIESFDLMKLEKIIYNIAAKELRAIEIFGGVLGFVVGLFQVAIILLGNRSLL